MRRAKPRAVERPQPPWARATADTDGPGGVVLHGGAAAGGGAAGRGAYATVVAGTVLGAPRCVQLATLATPPVRAV